MSTPHDMNPTNSAGPPTVLIVEDSLTQAFHLKVLFGKYGFQVTTANNGREALEVLEKIYPTIIVSDIQMPEMDGYGLCRRIKGDDRLRKIPVILLTSLSAPKDIVAGLESGADNYVMKPVDEDFLMARVRSVLSCSKPGAGGEDDQGVVVEISNERHVVNASRRQILSLLLSTYEAAVKTNHDLIRAHESLKKAQAQLIEAEKLSSVGRLAAGVAHEVRNPLAILEMGLAFVGDRAGSDDDRVIIDEMREAMKRANKVITNLMELPGEGEHGMQDRDLHAVIEAAFTALADQFARAEVTIVRELAASLPPSRIDTSQIEQVFVNVFTNSLQAMPEGGQLAVRTAVENVQAKDIAFDSGDRSGIRFREGDKAIVVEISDDGSGIAPDNLSKIFEPFFSTKPTGSGIGLGLTVSRKFMDRHHGLINVQNRPTGGVIVTLLFKIG